MDEDWDFRDWLAPANGGTLMPEVLDFMQLTRSEEALGVV